MAAPAVRNGRRAWRRQRRRARPRGRARARPRLGAVRARARGATAPVVVVGRDTRRSGPMLEDALCAGIAAAGGVALRAGVLPTPGVAWLVREQGASLGAVISASHNPFPDNGIKLFGADGFKLGDDEEDRVEALMGDASAAPDGRRRRRVAPSRRRAPSATRPGSPAAAARRSRCPPLRVLVDCANGAASTVAPLVFAQLGIEHEIIAAEPDGVNINDHVRLDAPRRARERRARRAASTSASRSTATPIACSRSTPTARSSTATRSSRCSRATCRSPGGWRATRSSSRRCRTSASIARCASSASRPS